MTSLMFLGEPPVLDLVSVEHPPKGTKKDTGGEL